MDPDRLLAMICWLSPLQTPRRTRAHSLALLSLTASLTASQISACAWPDPDQRLADEDPSLRLLETYPANGAVSVDLASQIDFCFDSPIDPLSLGTFDLLLVSGLGIFDNEVVLQLFPWRPPGGLGPIPESPWCPGSVVTIQPRSPLSPGTVYRVRLRPLMTGWGGETVDLLADPWLQLDDGRWATFVEFSTEDSEEKEKKEKKEKEEKKEKDPDMPVITLSALFESGGPFDPGRELCSCHRQPDLLAHQRLDLSSSSTAFEGLVLDQRIASTGYPRVTPARPSESFLIHKLLRDRDGAPLHGVRGAVMPPEDPLEYRALVMIARWIEDGALP
ncbi:MAG TPA: hypothetical protein ENJ18_16370 [Nannocystis exedens]|nr:hypothetical protein [Nannocystis exedens]